MGAGDVGRTRAVLEKGYVAVALGVATVDNLRIAAVRLLNM